MPEIQVFRLLFNPISPHTNTSDLTVNNKDVQVPTILQFGANVPQELARASSLAAPYVSGVDLNCGCPQSWACAETLGAALMNRRELVRDMVVETRARLASEGWAVNKDEDMWNPRGRSVSVKIRVHDDLRKTMDYLDTVIGDPNNRQVDWVTIHPRTRYMASTIPIRNEALEILTEKYSHILPIMLSGDVFDINALPIRPTRMPTITTKETQAEDNKTPRPSNTHLSGFMSARGLLSNPALYAGYKACPWEAVETFMCKVAKAPLPLKLAVHHIQDMVSPGMGNDKSALLSKKERAYLVEITDMTQLIDFLDEKIAEHKGQADGLRRDL